MQCENCKDRPAAIHLTQIVDNSVTTVHLCKECAEEKGVQTGASAAKFPLSDFLASMGEGGPTTEVSPADATLSCAFCQSTLQDFRDAGRLGCPVCYDSFRRHLRDLLRRLHGSSRHVGNQYLRRDPETVEVDDTLRDLRQQLRQAVEAERFELAAELRDRIRVLE